MAGFNSTLHIGPYDAYGFTFITPVTFVCERVNSFIYGAVIISPYKSKESLSPSLTSISILIISAGVVNSFLS